MTEEQTMEGIMREQITRINGNGKEYTVDLPKIIILSDNINDTALEHIRENTGLWFEKTAWSYTATPHNSNQIATLIMTYNFKTKYYNNSTYDNVLMLKFDHHVGFDVDSICFKCCEHNNIHTSGLKKTSRLSC